MKAAREVARQNGINVKFFVGDNLEITDDKGEIIHARGYIVGGQALVRADHPLYTAEQLMRHEAGHHLISQGKINLNEVRERLKKTAGEENLQKTADMYTDAYGGTKLTADEIWEECVCDSLGDMNIFAGRADMVPFTDYMLSEIKSTAQSQVKETSETRGPPEGKTSRETADGQYQGRGYDGHSMSVNARIAYRNGEMPLSKWNKSNILEAIEEIAFDEDIPYLNDNFNKLTLDELRGNFLKITSWHHTGQFYNQTAFYSLNEKAVKYALKNGTEHIISERKPKQAKTSAEKQAEIDNKKVLTKAYDIDRKLELIFISGVSGLKTKEGLVKRYLDGNLDLSTMYYSAIDAIHKKDGTRIDSWKKLPDGHWRKEYVKLYLADKEGYVIKEYLSYYNPHSNTNIQKIKNKLLKENVSQVKTSRETVDSLDSYKDKVSEIVTMSDEQAKSEKANGTIYKIASHTPSVILDNIKNAQDLEMIIRFDALYLATRKNGVLKGHYHDLGVNVMSNIIDYISNPDAIVEMDNGRHNIFAQMNGSGIISIEVNSTKDVDGTVNKYNLIVTAFSAKENYIRNLLEKHGITVEYKKDGLKQVNSQLYEWLTIIDNNPSNDSISQESDSVNREISDNGAKTSRELDFIDYLNETADAEAAPRELSNRAILVNALEGTVSNEIEEKRLLEYKGKLEKMNAEEAKLRAIKAQIKTLSFAKGPRDTAAIKELRDEATKTENRINIYDKQLLNLESTKALKNVLEREKAKAYKRAEIKGKEDLAKYREKAEARLKEAKAAYAEARARTCGQSLRRLYQSRQNIRCQAAASI